MLRCLAHELQINGVGELPCGFVLQIMGFIDDDMFIAGQDLIFQLEILQQQGVIGDDEHTVFAFLAIAHIIAMAEHAALAAQTGFCLAGDRRPVLLLQLVEIERFFVTLFGEGQPMHQLRQKEFLCPADIVGLLEILLKTAHADIIAAAFAQCHRKIKVQTLLQKRDVLVIQLLLQSDGIGGNQHPTLIFVSP